MNVNKRRAQHGYFKCAGCGNVFYINYTSLWAYKVPLFPNAKEKKQEAYACSWKCMSAVRDIQERKRAERRERQNRNYHEKKLRRLADEHRLEETG